jgi:SH3-like domain-containing protein
MEVQRREAFSAVKQAVRVYVRDPSPAHARQVEIAWRRIRQVDSVARWRHGPHRSAQRPATRRAS